MRRVLFAMIVLVLTACGSKTPVEMDEDTHTSAMQAEEPSAQTLEIDATNEVCGGFTGILCPSGYYCKQEDGQCLEELDGAGRCQPLPDVCTMDFTPVCGCNGQTYSNACQAGMAGMSVAIEGECLRFED